MFTNLANELGPHPVDSMGLPFLPVVPGLGCPKLRPRKPLRAALKITC